MKGHQVALVGAGRMGSLHASNIVASPRLGLAAIADHHEELAKKLAGELQTTARSYEQILADPEIEAMGAQFRHAARVRVTTRDGRKFHAELLNRRGSAENPLAPADIEHKFRQVVRSCLAPAQIERVVALVRDFDKASDCAELAAIVAAPTWCG